VVFAGMLDRRIDVCAADDAADAAWHSARRPPELAFDHRKILRFALKRIKSLQ